MNIFGCQNLGASLKKKKKNIFQMKTHTWNRRFSNVHVPSWVSSSVNTRKATMIIHNKSVIVVMDCPWGWWGAGVNEQRSYSRRWGLPNQFKNKQLISIFICTVFCIPLCLPLLIILFPCLPALWLTKSFCRDVDTSEKQRESKQIVHLHSNVINPRMEPII